MVYDITLNLLLVKYNQRHIICLDEGKERREDMMYCEESIILAYVRLSQFFFPLFAKVWIRFESIRVSVSLISRISLMYCTLN